MVIFLFLFFFPTCLYFPVFLQWIFAIRRGKKTPPSFIPSKAVYHGYLVYNWDVLPPHRQECLGNVSMVTAMARGSDTRLPTSVVNGTQAALSDIPSQASPRGCQGVFPWCPPDCWLLPRSGCLLSLLCQVGPIHHRPGIMSLGRPGAPSSLPFSPPSPHTLSCLLFPPAELRAAPNDNRSERHQG